MNETNQSKERVLSCFDCGAYHCDKRQSEYPDFCLTAHVDPERLKEIKSLYLEDPKISKLFHAAAEVEGRYYGKLTRVEETILFARKIGAKKIGIASCMGFINEATAFTKVLQAKGFDDYICVACKAGSIDKPEVGIPDELKVRPGNFEPCCNPILQAQILNDAKTELNVLIGLCVGHDSLFIKYAQAATTVLAVKDRVLVHNPMAALYASGSYYRRLLQKSEIE